MQLNLFRPYRYAESGKYTTIRTDHKRPIRLGRMLVDRSGEAPDALSGQRNQTPVNYDATSGTASP